MHTNTARNGIGVVLMVALVMCLAMVMPGMANAMQSRSSSFDSHFTMNGDGAHDMLAVAKAQEGRTQGSLGYTEGWCADFVSDCAKVIGQGKAVPFSGMVSSLHDAVIAAGGKEVSTPQPGDLVFFNGDDHVGIMSDTTTCISGNMGSQSKVSFCKVSWVISGAKVVYVRPAYGSSVYKVSFNANGGSGTMALQPFKRNKAKALKANAFTRSGYQFAGWNTRKDGSGKAYGNAQKLKNLAKAGKTVTLYAQWKKTRSKG